MFPLGTVLFPYVGLPLRIFELRYREMLKVCLAADGSFGVVLIANGSDVGGADDRFEIGTMAKIVHSEVDPDGQARIVAVGAERFRVLRWTDGALYPQAEVEFVVDADTITESRIEAIDGLTKRVRRLLATRTEMNIDGPPATIELHEDPEVRLWQLCALVPAEPHDDLALLASPTLFARAELLGRLLDQADEKTNRLLGR
jgi:uncharacterized protein